MKRGVTSLACGLLFALGLGISGMTSPRKIIGFLNVFGAWDPSLLLVMAGAVGVFAIGDRLSRRRPGPLAGGLFPSRTTRAIDGRLVAGASLFGVGWGIAGYCPGPAIVAVTSGAAAPAVFAGSMLLGMALAEAASRTKSRRA